ILLTANATAGWHYISVYPFVTIVAAYGVYALARALSPTRTAAVVGVVLVGALSLAYNGSLLAKYLANLRAGEPANSAWSPAIYRLSSYLQHTNGQIYTADWGISNPLFALHPARRYEEIAFLLETGTKANLQTVRTL